MSKINLISSVHYCSTILYRNAVMNRKEQRNNEAASVVLLSKIDNRE